MGIFSWDKDKKSGNATDTNEALPAPEEATASPLATARDELQASAATSAAPASTTPERRFPLERERMFDLDKTSDAASLMQVPRDQRDDAWTDAFLDAVWCASLEPTNPPFFEGPDTYTYLRLHVPTPGKPFQSNSLGNLAKFALERGAGIAIFASPEATEPEWVFSMGRLDSMLRYDSWQGDPMDLEDIARQSKPKTLPEGGIEEVPAVAGLKLYIGSPADSFLPAYTAAMLHRHMQQGWHTEEPRVSLLIAQHMAPTRSLVIGKKMSEFPDKETAGRHMQALLWYLPPARSVILMPESWTQEQMTPLSGYFRRVERTA